MARIANTDVTLEVGEVTADSAGPPVTVSGDQAKAVVDAVGTYLETAIVEPLRTGQPAGDLATVFAPVALARVNGADRAAMVDEGETSVNSVGG